MGEITTSDRLSYQKPLRNMMLSLWMGEDWGAEGGGVTGGEGGGWDGRRGIED